MPDNPGHVPDSRPCVVRDLPTLSGIVRPSRIFLTLSLGSSQKTSEKPKKNCGSTPPLMQGDIRAPQKRKCSKSK
jgi:hypothetical protein